MVILDVPNELPKNKLQTIGISRQTNENHLKLWQGYVKKNNEIVELLNGKKDFKKANATFSETRSQKEALSFAYGGYLNHKVYFNHLNGNCQPTKEFNVLIKESFGSFANFINDLKATALCSRGWAFVCYNLETESIINVLGDSQNTYPIWNSILIGAIDVYEHAYFADFGTDKEKYIDAILSIIDWNQIVKNIDLG